MALFARVRNICMTRKISAQKFEEWMVSLTVLQTAVNEHLVQQAPQQLGHQEPQPPNPQRVPRICHHQLQHPTSAPLPTVEILPSRKQLALRWGKPRRRLLLPARHAWRRSAVCRKLAPLVCRIGVRLKQSTVNRKTLAKS